MPDIQTALDKIKEYCAPRQTLIKYYDGLHKLAFGTEKFNSTFGETLKNLRDNLCPIVVDALADRMEIINFSGDETNKETAEAAWKLWQRERMELGSYDTHVEAIKTGCAYLIVWPDVSNKAKFYLQDSRNCVVIEDEETKEPTFGAKLWKGQDGIVKLTLYYPDRTEKYQTPRKVDNGQEVKAETFVSKETLPNPYGVIPMFAFETNPVLGDAIPIQDALNKTIADKMVAMEFAAFRQRYVTGFDPGEKGENVSFKAGVDRLWFVNEQAAKFGEFGEADLEKFLKVADSYRLEIARVSGTPLHFFSINTSDAISGEALKTLESRFTKKIARLNLNFGSQWGKVMKLALSIEGESVPENLTPQWEPVETRSEKEKLEVALLKADLDVPPEVLWEEIGYTEEDIAKFQELGPEEPLPGQPTVTAAIKNQVAKAMGAGQPVDPAVKANLQMRNGG